MRYIATSFLCAARAGVVDDDVTHRFRRDAEEVLPANGLARQVFQLQIGLIDHGRGLQRGVAMEFPELMVREAAQLTIQELDGPVIGIAVAVPVRLNEPGYVGVALDRGIPPTLYS